MLQLNSRPTSRRLLTRFLNRGTTLVVSAALACAAGAVLGPGVALGGTTLQPVVNAPVLVTGSSSSSNRLFVTPQLAVDPKTANTVVLADGDYRDGGCNLFVSTTGGMAWSNTTSGLLPSGYQYCVARPDGEPVVVPAFTADGKTLDVAMDATTPKTGQQHGPISVAFASTTNLGLTVSNDLVVKAGNLSAKTSIGQRSAAAEYRSATMAIDPTDPNRIYVGAERDADDVPGLSSSLVPAQPVVFVSNDGGRTWGAPIVLGTAVPKGPKGPYDGYTPVVMVSDTGTAYAVAEGDSSTGSYPMYVYKSTNHGATWTAQTITPSAKSADEPSAAIDPKSGALYVAWDQQTSAKKQNILFTSSTDGGTKWTVPTSLVPDAVAAHSDRYFPGLSVAPDGRVDVDWYDFRNDPFHPSGSSEQYADVYFTYSTDGGSTWANDIRVTPRSIDEGLAVTFADFTVESSAIASSNNTVYVAWPQPAASEPGAQAEDDYVTRIDMTGPVRPGAKASSSSKGTDALWAVIGAAVGLALAGLFLIVRRPRPSEPTPPAGAAA